MKYIDADKLRSVLQNTINSMKEKDVKGERYDAFLNGKLSICEELLGCIASLQQEQSMPNSTQLIELWHEDKEMLKEKDFRDDPWRLAYNAFMCGFGRGIAVKKQEQPEDVVVVAKAFLDALSKTPYNNKPITDAQIIVRQLLLFFENPKEYNPDAILEQPKVELEKEEFVGVAESPLKTFPRVNDFECGSSYRH